MTEQAPDQGVPSEPPLDDDDCEWAAEQERDILERLRAKTENRKNLLSRVFGNDLVQRNQK